MARWATIEEVAEKVRMSPKTLRNKASAGIGIGKLFYKVDGLRRADMDEVDAWMKNEELT